MEVDVPEDPPNIPQNGLHIPAVVDVDQQQQMIDDDGNSSSRCFRGYN